MNKHDLAGICDVCSARMATGDGYLVYSEIVLPFMGTFGAMHICEKCANELFSQEIWNAAQTGSGVLGIVDKNVDTFRKDFTHANCLSIAMRAIRRGLNPARARQDARNLAQLAWKNKEAAYRRLVAQSSLSKVDKRPDASKRRRWQIWK